MSKTSGQDWNARRTPFFIMGVGIDPVTTGETLGVLEEMMDSGRPHQVVTANVDFLTQARGDDELRRILLRADMVLCDGTPLLWASRWLGHPLPERVAGSDTVPLILARAAAGGRRVFFLGGRPEVLAACAEKVRREHAGLGGVEAYAPPFAPLLSIDHEEILRRVRAARPDLLLVAFGCPKQEKWIAMHLQNLGVPVVLGVGATVDFLAGHVPRAPRWMRRAGMEWIFRLSREPARLAGRYGKDLMGFVGAMGAEVWGQRRRPDRARSAEPLVVESGEEGLWVRWPSCWPGMGEGGAPAAWARVLESEDPWLLDLSRVVHLDNAGVGWLVLLWSCRQKAGRPLVLVAPSAEARRVLKLHRLEAYFSVAGSAEEASRLLPEWEERFHHPQAITRKAEEMRVRWRGEIAAARVSRMQAELDRDLKAVGAGDRVLIDLGEVSWLDSAGLLLLARTGRLLRGRGAMMRLKNCPVDVSRALGPAGLDGGLASGGGA